MFLQKLFLVFLACLVPGGFLSAAPKTIAEATKGSQKLDGYFPLYWEESTGRMLLEIPRWNQEFLFVFSLPAGVGSNDIGLDRGMIPGSRIVEFERTGPRVLLVEKNTQFRSSSSNLMAQEAMAESFATSVLWGFDVVAEDGGRVLVDATRFFQHDFVGVAKQLAEAHQGSFTLAAERCAFYLPQTKNFPQNTEVEATLTFHGEHPGTYLKDVVPTPEDVTVREHYSLIQLPTTGYQARAFDPRSGYFDLTYRDYSAPLGEDLDKRVIYRHRLVKRDPNQAMSEPVQPLVYYIDGGAPEDVRNALMEGAQWWNEAFEAAGFRNAFQVRVLPPDVDPMDIRYNVVQWVHRYTRGWSYGNAVSDPRTGEILKGQVTLGSLRYRQDYLIFSSLLSPFGAGEQPPATLKQAVYARLRQLAAHEIGHTLGLSHNYIASTHHDASVMDYPHPNIQLRPDGSIDLSHAYSAGIGSWDKVAIRYGYTEFPQGADEKVQLNKILTDAAREGNIFISDRDSRPLGSAHPKAHLWDNGLNAVDGLEHILKVRQTALARFGENSIPVGEPMARLDETLVPLYYLHRYQTEAAAKVLGGLDYTYALRGDGQLVTQIVAPDQQRRALQALLETIRPETLTIPERIVKLIPPHPPGYPRTRESFPSRTGVTFDPVAAAAAAADLTGSLLFQPERAARLEEYHARDAAMPGLQEVINAVAKATWQAPKPAGLSGEVKEATDAVLFERLLNLAADNGAPSGVRSIALQALVLNSGRVPAIQRQMLEHYQRNPKEFQAPSAPAPPPGQPIGENDFLPLSTQ